MELSTMKQLSLCVILFSIYNATVTIWLRLNVTHFLKRDVQSQNRFLFLKKRLPPPDSHPICINWVHARSQTDVNMTSPLHRRHRSAGITVRDQCESLGRNDRSTDLVLSFEKVTRWQRCSLVQTDEQERIENATSDSNWTFARFAVWPPCNL